jgi:hypothetical protein
LRNGVPGSGTRDDDSTGIAVFVAGREVLQASMLIGFLT